MKKQAAPIARSISDFAEILTKNGIKNSGKKIDKIMFGDNGTASFMVDFLSRGKAAKLKGVQKMQRGLADLDMKAGSKAYDFLDKRKSKRLNNLKNSFVETHDFLTQKGSGNNLDKFVRVKRTGITTPINKVKDKALPFVGSMTVANHLFGNKENDEYE